jgi:HD-GYP domain-containing protein (c-di-GMP phosphodiesterase class II)
VIIRYKASALGGDTELAGATMGQTKTELELSPSDQLLRILGDALDLRDNETAGHSRRVERYSLEIANALGCSGDQLAQIARSAYVHDIGKIAIPDAILRKPGSLCAEEFEVMRTHPWIGYNMLSRLPSLVPVAEIVLAHHERWDGSGYPRRLKGEEIPLGARVFAVADSLDAMTTDRPYRRAVSFSAAKEEIQRESGRQFDPKVVQAFVSGAEGVMRAVVLREKKRSVRVPVEAEVGCGTDREYRRLQAVNISEGGILLANALDVEVGKVLELQFCLPGVRRPLATQGMVVRKELPARIGISFVNISGEALEGVREYVGRRIGV